MPSCWCVCCAVVASVLITSLATVRAQDPEQVQCYSDSNVCSNGTVPPTLLTAEECCRGDGTSFSSATDGMCLVCIVFGFNQTSLTAPERGADYEIEVAFIKGDGGFLVFFGVDVEVVAVTAVEGLGNDFTTDPGHIGIVNPSTPATVRVNFRADGVALEPDETFRLTLNDGFGPQSGAKNVFLQDIAEFTIIDSDVVQISFTEDAYRAEEPLLAMPVVVTKTHIIASDITLTVTPLTIAEAEAQGKQPLNAPPEFDVSGLENSRAQSTGPLDFNPTILTITFLADEGVPGATPSQDISVPIPIIDDQRDEPDVEVFAACLTVTNVSNTVGSGAVAIPRNVCLCRITDDDPISIGFASSSFTTNEGGLNPDLVFLIKQDNRTSERGFLIDIRAVDAALPGSSVATLGLDYSVSTIFGERDVLLQFDTNEDRLPVPFEVILDFSSLGPEAFQLQSTNNANGPVFSPPNGVTVFSSTFVLIASQGDVVAGFESTNYTVNEVDRFVEICVAVTNPPPEQLLLLDFLVFEVGVMPTTFTGDSVDDFEFGLFAVEFNNTVRRDCFNINVICDDIAEQNERFLVFVFSIFASDVSPHAVADPSTAVLTITDVSLSIGAPFSNSLFSYNDVLDGQFANVNDGSDFVRTFTTPYILYGNSYQDVYIGSNGQISFGTGTSCCCNRTFPSFPPLVTAFWNDINLEIGGTIYHRVINSGSELADLGDSLRAVPGWNCLQFMPASAAVITFEQVSAFGGSSEINNTFQVILMTDGSTSYTAFLYNNMNWGDDDNTVIGFNDGDRFFTQECFPEFSTVRNLSSASNVNISGVFVFSSDSVTVDVLCFANVSCTGLTVASTGVSPKECCLGRGLSYDVCGRCYTCNVYGWEQSEFEAMESEESYLLSIGVTKGSLALEAGSVTEQTFNIQHTGGTATPGVNGDFAFTPGITSLSSRQLNSSVLVTLRADGFALEEPETIQLTLQSSVIPFPCTHYFIQDAITITILDIDTVRVFMNASIAVESQRQLRLRVEKTGTIANTLTVAVQLLTVANATELGLVLPDDLPSDDSSSPNRAESGPGNDFLSSETILATFSSDEDINVFICPIQDIFVTIIDDKVNEAAEQYFLAHLNHTVTAGSAVNLSSIVIDQPLVTCVILDDDAISIEFGEEQYNTSEELEAVNITLTKNLISEQTFSFNITSSSPDSLDDIDVEMIGAVDFPPDQQTLSVTIPLVNDDETEGTETHLLRIVQDPSGPQFDALNRQQTAVVIRDDEVFGCSGSGVPVRLQGGPSEREGRVEYCSEDEWAPICGSSLTLVDAGRICQMLNFTNGVEDIRSSASLRIAVDTYLDNFTCSDANCSSECCFSTIPSCLQTTAVACKCNDGTARLVEGSSDTYQEVQQCVAGEWFPVCAEFWDSRDGNVVCGLSQQNTSSSVRDTAIVTSIGTINDTSFVRRQCEGTEGRLNECQQLSSDQVCSSGRAYVLCQNLPESQRQCNDSDIRLVNGSSNGTGRVEICSDGVWGTVCSQGWDDSDATVACRQLEMGFLTGSVSSDHSPGTGPILLSNVSCSGTEDSLWNCSSLGVGVHNCIDHSLDAGVTCQGPSTSSSVGASFSTVTTPTPTSVPLSAGALAGIGVAASVLGLVIVVCLVLIIWTAYRTGKHKHQRPVTFTFRTVDTDAVALKNPLSQYCENISDDLLISHTSLRLLDVLGQGEFGVVYKAHLITPSSNTLRRMSGYRTMNRQSKAALEVAVKTLHAFFSDKDVAALMDEFLRMRDFDHHNVLTILGVCVDAGAAPYIVMPYMSNGSLLEFVRDNRDTFVITDPLDTNLSFMTTKKINICLQISKGMEYLASNNVIHRDLAARNCMISGNWVVKVADFGLSMKGYAHTYTKLKKEADTKLPIKWMSPEAFNLDKFSEKSDAWSFGVTCWEVYSGGSTPYPGMNDPKTLVDFLHGGGRLDKPTSITCSDEMYELLLSCWEEDMHTRPSFSQLVQRIEIVLGMVTGYVQLATAPLQQLRASDDTDDKDEDGDENIASDESACARESDKDSVTSDDCSLSANDVLQTDLSTVETTM